MKANDHICIRPTYLNLYHVPSCHIISTQTSWHWFWQGLSPSPQSSLPPTLSPGSNQVVVVVVVLLLQLPLEFVCWLIPSGQIGRSSNKFQLSRDSALQSNWQMAGPTSSLKLATIFTLSAQQGDESSEQPNSRALQLQP